MRTRLLMAVLGLALLAACSSSSSKPTAQPTSSSTVAATTTTSTVAPQSKGCGATGVTAGETKITITSGGESRWYFRHVPTGYDASKPMPLVVDIHGYQEGAGIHKVISRMGEYGDAHGFITVTPEGTGPVPHWDTTLGSNDVNFIGAVMDDVENALCVDLHRVYATGYSNGAFMSSAVACVYGDRVAAVAPVAGIIANIKGCKPARPVPVVTFHGTKDGFVAFGGGLGKDALNLPASDGSGKKLSDNPAILKLRKGLSIPQQVAAWAKRNGCASTATETKVAADVTRVGYSCPSGDDVVFYRIEGGGHAWPGSVFGRSIANVVGFTTFSINADAIMWKFFEAHPLP